MKSNFLSIIKFNKKKSSAILFLGYLILIAAISVFIYLIIPKFMNYENKTTELDSYTQNDYNINLSSIKRIRYKVLPTPRLIITTSNIKFLDKETDSKELELFLKLNSLLKKNFSFSKIKLKNLSLKVNEKEIEFLLNEFNDLSKPLIIDNSEIIITSNKNEIFKINRVSLNNLNTSKIEVKGNYIGKDLKFTFSKFKNHNVLNLRSNNLDMDLEARFKKKDDLKNFMSIVKLKILDNFFSFNFLKNEKISIYKGKYRNKNLKINFDSEISLSPFFYFKNNIQLQKISLREKDFEKLIQFYLNSESINKFNGTTYLTFNNDKKFTERLIKNLSMSLILENGNMIIKKLILKIPGAVLSLSSKPLSQNDLKKFKFESDFHITEPKKFKKFFSLKKNIVLNDKFLSEGIYSPSSNRVEITNILLNGNKKISDVETEIIQENFQNIFLSKSILGIFNKSNIESFLEYIGS